jgi:peptidoglycan/LPS O-acetylase OafA/YrhL
MTRKNKHLLVGIALIIVSIVLIFFNLRGFEGGFNKVWPAILLLFGVLLFIFYFSTRKKKRRLFVLFLATFIATSSVPLFVLTFSSFENITIVWPAFLFTFGLSLLSMFYYGNRKKILAVLSTIIISASLIILIIYSMETQFGLVIGASIFLLGAVFLTRGLGGKAEQGVTDLGPADTTPAEEEITGSSSEQDEEDSEDNSGA